jgi:hypothetical protein
MQVEDIMLNEKSQTCKDKQLMIAQWSLEMEMASGKGTEQIKVVIWGLRSM